VRSMALLCLCMRRDLHPRSPGHWAAMRARACEPHPRLRRCAAEVLRSSDHPRNIRGR
jgi:hypothetical protein